jgi:hypothetical protein
LFVNSFLEQLPYMTRRLVHSSTRWKGPPRASSVWIFKLSAKSAARLFLDFTTNARAARGRSTFVKIVFKAIGATTNTLLKSSFRSRHTGLLHRPLKQRGLYGKTATFHTGPRTFRPPIAQFGDLSIHRHPCPRS